MTPAILTMLERYHCKTTRDYENALKEIIQEIALLGLWRSKFFEHAAFYGGTALRIIYGLDRFSEELDFSLLKPQKNFKFNSYLKAIEVELTSLGFSVIIEHREKKAKSNVDSAFIKAGTREHLLKVSSSVADRIQKNAILNIKVEVDTDPPGNFQTESKVLLQPIPFSVVTFQKPDLFAGKIHAILERNWKGRVKGRDYYDFVWYLSQKTPVRLCHLEQRLRQSGAWDTKKELQLGDLLKLLEKKFGEVDFKKARQDVLPFLKDADSVKLWSENFFKSLLSRLDDAK